MLVFPKVCSPQIHHPRRVARKLDCNDKFASTRHFAFSKSQGKADNITVRPKQHKEVDLKPKTRNNKHRTDVAAEEKRNANRKNRPETNTSSCAPVLSSFREKD